MAHERTGKTRTREAADKTADDHHNGGISRIDACDPIGFGDRQFPERGNRFLSRVDFNGICAKRSWRNDSGNGDRGHRKYVFWNLRRMAFDKIFLSRETDPGDAH